MKEDCPLTTGLLGITEPKVKTFNVPRAKVCVPPVAVLALVTVPDDPVPERLEYVVPVFTATTLCVATLVLTKATLKLFKVPVLLNDQYSVPTTAKPPSTLEVLLPLPTACTVAVAAPEILGLTIANFKMVAEPEVLLPTGK